MISIIVTMIMFVVLDTLWFTFSLPRVYMPKFTEIQNETPNMLSKMHGGAFAWFLMALGVQLFVLPLSENIYDSMKYGFLYGLIVFGVYNGTNYVTFNKYDASIFFPDMIWGLTVCTIVSALSYYLK